MKKSYLKLALSVVFALVLGLSSCTKEKATGRIQGIVTNMNTTEPIQGVNISLSPTGASAVTGSDGRYEFNNLEAGNYTVQGVKAGFESNTKNISITAGNVSSGDMQLRPAATGFRLNVEYLDFGTNFSQLQFKIICRHAQHRQPARRPRDHHHSEHRPFAHHPKHHGQHHRA